LPKSPRTIRLIQLEVIYFSGQRRLHQQISPILCSFASLNSTFKNKFHFRLKVWIHLRFNENCMFQMKWTVYGSPKQLTRFIIIFFKMFMIKNKCIMIFMLKLNTYFKEWKESVFFYKLYLYTGLHFPFFYFLFYYHKRK
jgi:hypothetical protein